MTSLVTHLRDHRLSCSAQEKSRGNHLHHHLFQLLWLPFCLQPPPGATGWKTLSSKSQIIPKKQPRHCSWSRLESPPLPRRWGLTLPFLLSDTCRILPRRTDKKKGISEYARQHFHRKLHCRWTWRSQFSPRNGPRQHCCLSAGWEGNNAARKWHQWYWGAWQLLHNWDEEFSSS